ncbi:cobalt-zinc-cadmium efflux system membrane fusion protein [Pedobacter sp. CG_S7]|uniref:efflux RND transporter periplasmic adaptor subunit n=1 Tax=Pedobacter sp. CG_S7 TaxID=3143930 RepID=UPI003392C781
MKNYIIMCVTIVLLFSSCKNEEKDEAVKNQDKVAGLETNLVQFTADQVKNAGIAVHVAEQKEMHRTLNVNGVVEAPPENVFSISIPLGGYVKKTTLIPGMMVRKGSVLVIIEDQKYVLLQQEYLSAKNRLKFATADYVRQKGLNITKATSDKLFQQTESDYAQQKILLGALAEQLRLVGINPSSLNENNISRAIKVYAPIDGYITQVNVNTGKYVQPTDILFELINPSKLHVNLTVLENDASKLKVGQKIVCTTNKDSKKKYFATVKLVTPHIGDDRSISVHCDLENSGSELLPGNYLNATINLSNANVTALPDEAIVKWENKFYIFTDEGNNQFKMINIETGIGNEGFTEIKTPLNAKRIVVKNAYAILMKMKNGGEEG